MGKKQFEKYCWKCGRPLKSLDLYDTDTGASYDTKTGVRKDNRVYTKRLYCPLSNTRFLSYFNEHAIFEYKSVDGKNWKRADDFVQDNVWVID